MMNPFGGGSDEPPGEMEDVFALPAIDGTSEGGLAWLAQELNIKAKHRASTAPRPLS